MTGSETDLSELVSGDVGEVSYSLSGEGLTGCSVTPSGTFTAGDVIGTCVVAVTAAGDKNHEAASKEMQISVCADVSGAPVTLADGQGPFVYTGNAIEPEFVVKVGDVELVLDTDYTLGLSNNTNAGTATATIAGKGNYAGTKAVEFSIARKPVTVTAEDKSKAYGEADPVLTATVVGLVGEDAVRYEVSREQGDNAGEYAITPTGEAEQGNYSVSYAPGKLIISKADASAAEVDPIASQKYTGSAVTPRPVVRMGSATLAEGADYDLSYWGNVESGTATVTVTGKGNYAGSTGATFTIAARDFPDVPSDQYYYEAVRWAYSKGVASGYANGRFGPNDNVTREQLAAMLANYHEKVAGKAVSGSAADYDSMGDKGSVSDWARTAVGSCFQKGILNSSKGLLRPQGNASRAEASKMVVGLYDLL